MIKSIIFKEENNSNLLRQTFLYDNECLKTERWKDFMKRRYIYLIKYFIRK